MYELSKQIHADAITGEMREWREKYLYTATRQRLGSSGIARDDKLDRKYLAQIANHGGAKESFNLDAIEAEVTAENERKKPTPAQQQR